MASSIETKNSFPKIFISYNHKDQSVAFKIKDKLVGAGLEVIIDAVELGTGGNIPDFIIKSIQKTDITLSLVSTNSLMSSWVAMETLWSNNEETLRGRAFMPCNIDNEFFEVEFTDNVLDAIDIKLEKINKTLKLRLEKNRDFDDLIDDRKRFNQLKVELPLTIRKLKNSLCVNLSDEHFTSGIEKVINDIKKTITKNEGIKIERLENEGIKNERIKNENEEQNKLIAAQRLREKQEADENERLEQQRLEAIKAEQKRLQKIEQDKKEELERLRKEKLPEIQDFMVFVKGGIFTMGSPENEADRRGDETRHQVTLSSFYMSKYAITFEQYDAYCEEMGLEMPADEGWGRKRRPVINVSWDEANSLARWIGGRLPTEAEWEYACRAGTSTLYYTGQTISKQEANYYDGVEGKTLPVGLFSSNDWGLYDMHGNVWEFCNDWYKWYGYSDRSQTNPQGPLNGDGRVIRGGSWNSDAKRCRSDRRNHTSPDDRDSSVGFRLVFPG